MSEHNNAPTPDKKTIELCVKSILNEHRKERRWIYGIRFLRTVGFVLASCVALVIALRPGVAVWDKSDSKEPHTAVIEIEGMIQANAPASIDRLYRAIQSAFDNEQSKAIVLRINSPGGSPVQASLIYEEIMLQRSANPEKPVYAVIEDMGVSGAYYVAMAANEVFANQASLIGSIGVISSGFGFTDLMEKVGIERRTMTAGTNKALLDPFSPLTPEHRQFWEDILAQTHAQFIELVRDSRGSKLQEEDEPNLFSGLVWNGVRAVELGLIDGIRSVSSVARDVVGAEKVIDYTPKQDVFSKLAGRMTLEVSDAVSRVIRSTF